MAQRRFSKLLWHVGFSDCCRNHLVHASPAPLVAALRRTLCPARLLRRAHAQALSVPCTHLRLPHAAAQIRQPRLLALLSEKGQPLANYCLHTPVLPLSAYSHSI